MNTFKIILTAAALFASSQAFAQNFDRGTDPRAAGVNTVAQQNVETVQPRLQATAAARYKHNQRVEELRLR